jgi:hypothetical protein
MKRGRPSSGDLAVLIGRPMPPAPPPPPELTDAQATVWRDAVGGLPSDYIERGAYPLLIEYTRRVCRLRLLEIQIRQFEQDWIRVEGGLERFDQLLSMADRECRATIALARSLRLSPQSVIRPDAAGRKLNHPRPGPRPWDAVE